MQLLQVVDIAKKYNLSTRWLYMRSQHLNIFGNMGQKGSRHPRVLPAKVKEKDAYFKAASKLHLGGARFSAANIEKTYETIFSLNIEEILEKDFYVAKEVKELTGFSSGRLLKWKNAGIIKYKNGVLTSKELASIIKTLKDFLPTEVKIIKAVQDKEAYYNAEKPKKQADLQKPVKPRNIMISAVIEEPYFHKLKKLDLKEMTTEEKEECFTRLLHKGFISVPLVVKN